MKKSQLKRIIKEEIKRLKKSLKEQGTGVTLDQNTLWHIVHGTQSTGGSIKCNTVVPNVYQGCIGMHVDPTNYQSVWTDSNYNVLPGFGHSQWNTVISTPGNPPPFPSLYPDFASCQAACIVPNQPGTTCPSWGALTGPSTFIDWANDWVNNSAFTPPLGNNQPCNHICQRIDVWTTKLNNNANPNSPWAMRLQCKINEGQYQSQSYGCTC